MENFKYSNEVIGCVKDLVTEKFSDLAKVDYDQTEPSKIVVKTKMDEPVLEFCCEDGISVSYFDGNGEVACVKEFELLIYVCFFDVYTYLHK